MCQGVLFLKNDELLIHVSDESNDIKKSNFKIILEMA